MTKKNTAIIFIATQVTLLLLSCYHPKRQDEERMTSSAVNMIQYEGFKVRYNIKTMQPDWVEYTLTAAQVYATKNTPKVPHHFMPDPNQAFPQATSQDYKGSGWSRGHMARHQDMKWSLRAVQESDYYTNICPQHDKLNTMLWKRIENIVRKSAKIYDSVHVVCGPIFTDTINGYIGSNRIPIPDYFFKALLIQDASGYHAIAFLCPNNALSLNLNDVVCSVDKVEALSDIDIYSYLPDEVETIVESQYDLMLWIGEIARLVKKK